MRGMLLDKLGNVPYPVASFALGAMQFPKIPFLVSYIWMRAMKFSIRLLRTSDVMYISMARFRWPAEALTSCAAGRYLAGHPCNQHAGQGSKCRVRGSVKCMSFVLFILAPISESYFAYTSKSQNHP